jgi:hypothetical protein
MIFSLFRKAKFQIFAKTYLALGSFSLRLLLHHRLIAANQSVLFGAAASFIDNNPHTANTAFVSWALLGLSTYLFF